MTFQLQQSCSYVHFSKLAIYRVQKISFYTNTAYKIIHQLIQIPDKCLQTQTYSYSYRPLLIFQEQSIWLWNSFLTNIVL